MDGQSCHHLGHTDLYRNATNLSLETTPTKRPNAQHLVEYEKQLLYEENKKSGNVMQQPMDSYVCGINTSSESNINFSRDKPVPVEFWYCNTYFMRKVNLTIRVNFLTSNLYPKRKNA